MAYRLQRDESISDGLRRVVTKELRAAVNQLADVELSDDAIHDARKSIKKVRAVLQLLRHEVGTQHDRKRLTRAGRFLSPLRDADAMLATARAFCDQGRQRFSDEACTAIGDVLKRHKERLSRAARHDQAARRAAKALEQIRRSAKSWPWKRARFSVLAAEIRRSYKKARRGMRTAQDRNGARDFHQWRKRVKTLWYALRLLEDHVPLRRHLADLERLETWLGEDHNLLTLRAHVLTSCRLRTSARAEVRALSGQRQAELRRRALSTGARLFNAKPTAFIQPLRRQWRNRHDRARRVRRRTRPSRHDLAARHVV